jgi:hypothetical protein
MTVEKRKARVFFPGNHFQVSLIFESRPVRVEHFMVLWYLTMWVGSLLMEKKTRVFVLDIFFSRVQHFSGTNTLAYFAPQSRFVDTDYWLTLDINC